MMDMSRKQLEFFTALIWIALLTAIIVLAIDFQIKGSILEQANAFRRQYEEWVRGQTGQAATDKRPDNYRANDPAYPSDMVPGGHAVVEAPGHNGSGMETGSASTPRPSKPRRATGRSPVSGDGEQI